MKAAVTVFQAILIFIITVTLVSIGFVWFQSSFQESVEVSEIQRMRNEFEICSDKLIETINTGTSNRCIFSNDKGEISIENGLLYRLESSYDICDQQDWSEVENYVYQKCDENGLNIYQLRWNHSEIIVEGTGSGNSIDIIRSNSTALRIEFG
jgi:hypothetical protein